MRGKTDMRKGIDGLASTIISQEEEVLFDEEAIFLFCGGKKDRYKSLYWEADGFSLLYKRIEKGKLQWPKGKEPSLEQLNHQQYKWLLEGLSIVQPKAVQESEVGHII